MSMLFDSDAVKSLHDTLQVKVNGEVYDVRDITDDLLAEITKTADINETDVLSGDGAALCLRKQLGILTDKTPDTFEGVSIRVLSGIMDWIMEQVQDPRGREKAKNVRRK